MAACLAAVAPLVQGYVWQQDAFALCDSAEYRCPWLSAAALPGPLLWAELHHEDTPEDAWLTLFLLSTITTTVPGTVARLMREDGSDLVVTELAEVLPRWVDSSKYGTLDDIGRFRFWIHRGALHLVPVKGPHKLAAPIASPAAALAIVRNPACSTAACARAQETMRRRVREYPRKARCCQHAARVLLPARAAAALLADPQLVAQAVSAFLVRTPDDMQRASAHAYFPRSDERLAVLRMTRFHYAALVLTPFSRGPAWPLPAPSAPSAPAAHLGLPLCIGLEIVAARCGARPPGDDAASTAEAPATSVAVRASCTPVDAPRARSGCVAALAAVC